MQDTGTLRSEFLADHRALIQGLERLRDAVESGRAREAHEIANELDWRAGPHMAFEEEVLYPSLRRILGDRAVSRLYAEHGAGEDVVRELVRRVGDDPFEPEERDHALARIAIMQDHALSCGTLLSHVDGMEADIQAEMLERLLALRETPMRWSELPVGSEAGRHR